MMLNVLFLLIPVSAIPIEGVTGFRPFGKVEQPANTKVKTIVRGFGTQNFTCTTDGKFMPLGAVARLYDLSSVQMQLPENKATKQARMSKFDTPLIGQPIGYHESEIGSDGKAAPVWSFANDMQSRFHGKLLEAVDGPVAPAENVKWLLLGASGKGQYADYVIRSETLGGLPPTRRVTFIALSITKLLTGAIVVVQLENT